MMSQLLHNQNLGWNFDMILEIAVCSKNKQSMYEVFHLHDKDYIMDAHATKP